MIVQAVNLMNSLKGPKQFIIPIYQRTYSWALKECGQLSDKTRGKEYTLADHPHLTSPMLELFNQFRKRVLNLDSSVTEEILKLYITYKSATNFVDVVPQKSRLRLSINMRFSEIDDPKGLCKDVTDLGRWGNGDVEVGLSSAAQLEDIMYLVTQSFERNMENGNH